MLYPYSLASSFIFFALACSLSHLTISAPFPSSAPNVSESFMPKMGEHNLILIATRLVFPDVLMMYGPGMSAAIAVL